jgi:hypothetical protein
MTVPPSAVVKVRTRPPSEMTLFGMNGSQSGRASKPPISCHTVSADAGMFIDTDVLAIFFLS